MKSLAPLAAAATIRLNTFAGAYAQIPKSQRDHGWAELCDQLELMAKVTARPGDPREQKKKLPAFTLGVLVDNKRGEDRQGNSLGSADAPYNLNANYLNHTALAIDVDTCQPETLEVVEASGLAAFVYATPTDPNPDGSRRVRIVVPLSEPIAPDDVEHARLGLAEWLGIGPGQGVETAKAIRQIMFTGRLHGTPPRDVWRFEGEPLDVAETLARPLTAQWKRAPKHPDSPALERLAIADADERTTALLEAIAPHWAELEEHREALRGFGGYLARRGWPDEQIAAVARGLAPDRPVTNRVALAVECARSTRASNGDTGAGWSTLVAKFGDAAALIESVAKDPREPVGFAGVWAPCLAKMFARAANDISAAARAEPFAPAADSDTPVTVLDEQRTDLGNARRLVRGHGNSLRYFEARKLWYVWDGARWKADSTGEIMRAAKSAAESLWAEAKDVDDDDKRKGAFAWAAKCQDRQRLTNMIELAKSEPGIPVVASDLDAHPWLLNVQNGTLDLRTGELSDPDPALLMTKCCATRYDPDARSELWESFVNRTTGNDTELAAYIQRSLGYALFGAWREKAFWFGYGPPDGAKSTLLGAIGDVLGDYHVAAAASTWMVQNNVGGNRGDVTRLLGARFVTSLEIRPGLRFDEELVKKVTGGDTIVAAGKYENEIQFPPTFALWMGANDRPTIRDDDEGMWSRMRCVPFTNPVPDSEKDPHLREKLTSEEHAPAVLAWLVAGCIAWQREGVGKCEAVTTATKAYRADMNRAGAFFEECCELVPGAETPAKAMRHAYEDWCKSNAVRNPLAANALGQRLRALGATGGDDASRRVITLARKAVGTIPGAAAVKDRFWSGVRLRTGSE